MMQNKDAPGASTSMKVPASAAKTRASSAQSTVSESSRTPVSRASKASTEHSPARQSGTPSKRGARATRSDGDATVRHIITKAGELFAEKGYADTTSKAICERAGVNMAAVNYHFGSRDGLYLVLLKEVHKEVMSLDFVRKIGQSAAPASEKLYLLIQGLLRANYDAKSWHIRLWARELLSPSPILSQIMREEAWPKFEVLRDVIMELTGMPVNEPKLLRSILSVIGPVLLMLVIDRRIETPIQPLYEHTVEEMARHMHTFAIAGLKVVAQDAGYGVSDESFSAKS